MTDTPALTADDYREDGIRGYHQRCRDKWGERAPDYCADCFLLSRLAIARHVRETGCEGLREAALAYRDLTACLRIGKTPSESLFRRLAKADAALAAPAASPEDE